MTFDSWSPIASTYDPLKAGSIDGTDEEPHDKGIMRALNSKHRPNKGVVGDPRCTVFVARLHPDTTEDTLSDFFSTYGRLKRVKLIRDIITGFSKGYAFVEFEEPRHASIAHRDANRGLIDGQEVFVEQELARTLEGWIPRRFGGGLGGKKEAGQLRFGGKDRPFRKPIILDKAGGRPGEGGGERNVRRYEPGRHRGYEPRFERSRSPDLSHSRRAARSPESSSANRRADSPDAADRRSSHHYRRNSPESGYMSSRGRSPAGGGKEHYRGGRSPPSHRHTKRRRSRSSERSSGRSDRSYRQRRSRSRDRYSSRSRSGR